MKRILVVDDSAISRDIVVKILGDGYETIRAVNGVDALAKIKESQPDLVLLDLLMPELDGFGVLKNMQDEGVKIPVLVLSADIQKSTLARALELGAAAIINKPLDPDRLRAAVIDALGSSKGRPSC